MIDGRENKSPNAYKVHALKCLNLANTTSYTRDYQFTTEELLSLTPIYVISYGNLKAYGTLDPYLKVDNPMHYCLITVEYTIKAISYYLPNRLVAWDIGKKSGNPTWSVEMTELIKTVKKRKSRK